MGYVQSVFDYLRKRLSTKTCPEPPFPAFLLWSLISSSSFDRPL